MKKNKLFVIIGIQKAGTTSIYDILSYSNEIYMPAYLKDYHLFFHPSKNKQIIDKYRSNKYSKSLHCGVNYINFKSSIIEILKFDPDAKFILILRNPIKRAISAYYYARRMGIENRNLNDIVKHEINKTTQIDNYTIDFDKDYFIHGLYYKLIKDNLFQYVQKENIGIFFFEEIFAKNEANIGDLRKFIGLSEFNFPKSIRKNVQGDAQFKFLNRLLFTRNQLKTKFGRWLPPDIRVKLKNVIYERNYIATKSYKDNDIDFNLLIDFFKQDVNNLSELVNKNLFEFWFNEN